ncbi:Threonine/homoserine/homoserine lactone efflux protein [Enterobacter sp. kpr-6]|uniref:LysE family translocator n=1 Tax=Enterobacter sp. kpr-6 TaxID=1761782 RepID=UPI0008EE3579|nr:LysE family translocator [Enterobacter sp. kpr-6]SFQ97892.1 Threonine/homoserine/homoserine lactone efflux protein [Enterobacter sp. kpr-6]
MNIYDSLLAFTAAAALLTLTPGLDTALILRTASVESKSNAFKAAMGINVGCFIWGAMVAFGLGALIAVSELAYNILKYCGAAYLCWLGLIMLLRPGSGLTAVDAGGKEKKNWFVKGLLGNLLNPKMGVFYVSFLPQFIPQGQPLIAWTFGLVAIHVMLGMSWSTVLILATRPLARFLKRDAVSRWMDRCTGTLFLLFATKLALSKR